MKYKNGVQMVWHNDERIQLDKRETIWERYPFPKDDLSYRAESHIAICNFTEQQLPFVRDYRDEICAGLGVLVAFQTNGMAMARDI